MHWKHFPEKENHISIRRDKIKKKRDKLRDRIETR